MVYQKHPKRRYLALQPSGQLSGFILTRMVASDQGTKSCVPGLPLPTGGRRFGHLAQTLQFRQRPPPTGGKLRVTFFGHPFGGAHQMGQTGLAMVHPGLIDPVAITDQDAFRLLPTSLRES
jgi:hypothetical protein